MALGLLCAGMLCTGCGDVSPGQAPSGGGELLTGTEGETAEAAETTEPAETAESAETGAEAGDITAASGQDWTVAAHTEPRDLTDDEIAELQRYINEPGSYGFLLSLYDRPEQIDAEEVFYTGAGLNMLPLSEEEKEEYLEAADLDYTEDNILRLTAEQVNGLLVYRTGISYKDLENKPDWIYLQDYDAYYQLRGVEDSNICRYDLLDGYAAGGYYTIHYRLERAVTDSAEHVPVYEAVLKKNGDTFRFCCNCLWFQKDLLPQTSCEAAMSPDMGETFFCTYAPDTRVDAGADVSFCLVRGREEVIPLQGTSEGNIRKDAVFAQVEAFTVEDLDGDSLTDILTVCRYEKRENYRGREDGREVRFYRGNRDGVPTLDPQTGSRLEQKVEDLNLTNLRAALRGEPAAEQKAEQPREEPASDPEESGNQKAGGRESYAGSETSGAGAASSEAGAASASSAGTSAGTSAGGAGGQEAAWKDLYLKQLDRMDMDSYKGFALLYINDNRVPELAAVGYTPMQGIVIFSCLDGKVTEQRVSLNFSYMERENLLYSNYSLEGVSSDVIYRFSGGALSPLFRGEYGNMRGAAPILDAEGKPVYTYVWENTPADAVEYASMLGFHYDKGRAKTIGNDLMDAEKIRAALEK